jgi:hypothetical protein
MYNEQRQLARDSDAIPLFSKTKQAFFWMCFTFFSNRRDAKKNLEKKLCDSLRLRGSKKTLSTFPTFFKKCCQLWQQNLIFLKIVAK